VEHPHNHSLVPQPLSFVEIHVINYGVDLTEVASNYPCYHVFADLGGVPYRHPILLIIKESDGLLNSRVNSLQFVIVIITRLFNSLLQIHDYCPFSFILLLDINPPRFFFIFFFLIVIIINFLNIFYL
jgi:hypothetical protein